MVSFGAAPALIAYEWALQAASASRAGSPPSSTASCAALRLARFNTNIGVVDKRFFQGLPSPAAAALVMGFIWVMDNAGLHRHRGGPWLGWTTFAFTLYAGLTMVTNVPFYSFKDLSLKRSVPFVVIVLIALGIAVINIHPPIVLFGLFVVYGVSGYGVYVWKQDEGQAGQRDRNIDRRTRRTRLAPLTPRVLY